MRDLALQCAGAGRADLHVMAADEQPGSARTRTVGREGELLAAEPHGAIGDLHRQLDQFADEAMHERAGRAVIDVAGVPICSMRPLSITTTRLATSSASS